MTASCEDCWKRFKQVLSTKFFRNVKKGCCQLKVWSLFSVHIFKNVMNNYAWTLIIWWKRKLFIYFIKCYWIKNLLSIVIQNKKYLAVFHKHKINSLHVYYLISCVIFGVCLHATEMKFYPRMKLVLVWKNFYLHLSVILGEMSRISSQDEIFRLNSLLIS